MVIRTSRAIERNAEMGDVTAQEDETSAPDPTSAWRSVVRGLHPLVQMERADVFTSVRVKPQMLRALRRSDWMSSQPG